MNIQDLMKSFYMKVKRSKVVPPTKEPSDFFLMDPSPVDSPIIASPMMTSSMINSHTVNSKMDSSSTAKNSHDPISEEPIFHLEQDGDESEIFTKNKLTCMNPSPRGPRTSDDGLELHNRFSPNIRWEKNHYSSPANPTENFTKYEEQFVQILRDMESELGTVFQLYIGIPGNEHRYEIYPLEDRSFKYDVIMENDYMELNGIYPSIEEIETRISELLVEEYRIYYSSIFSAKPGFNESDQEGFNETHDQNSRGDIMMEKIGTIYKYDELFNGCFENGAYTWESPIIGISFNKGTYIWKCPKCHTYGKCYNPGNPQKMVMINRLPHRRNDITHCHNCNQNVKFPDSKWLEISVSIKLGITATNYVSYSKINKIGELKIIY